MQLVGKFLGEKITRVYERIKIHTEDQSIHRTSAEIRAEITEEDIPVEIARLSEVEEALAGKVDRVNGKELMPSPGETPQRDRFLNEQGEYVSLDSDYMVLDATMTGEKEFTVDRQQLQEYIDRAIIGGDSGLTVFFKFPFQYWNEYYKVTFVVHQLGHFHLIAAHPIMFATGRKGIREYRYHFLYDVAGERPFDPGKGMFVDSEFYTSDYLDTLFETKADNDVVQAHIGDTENPHRVTKDQIGLGNVENTADADKPVSKAAQQALDGLSGTLQGHVSDGAIHKTSAQIRSEITESDIPPVIARDAEVDAKLQAHNESGEMHTDLRNAIANLENGVVEAGSAEYARKLGTAADSYTKAQLDVKLNRHIKDVVYDAEQAKFTFVFEDGREIVVDTPLEHTVTDGHYDHETLELVLELVSGQEIRIPVAGMMKVYTGKDTATATTTINAEGEVSVAVKPGALEAVHLSTALLDAINSHLTLTGDTKDNIVTFPDQASRTNLASGDKHSLLFGKIKRWFTDLKALAFKERVAKADLDTSLQSEIDGKVNIDGSSVMTGVLAVNNVSSNALKACLGKNTTADTVTVSLRDATDAVLCSLAANIYNAIYYNGSSSYFLWHQGNLLLAPANSTIVGDLANKVPQYNSQGYLSAYIFKDGYPVDDTVPINEICYRWNQADGYHRWCTLAKLKSVLQVLGNSGDQTITNGRFYLQISSPDHVVMFREGTTNLGFIGYGSYPTKHLHIMNYVTNKYLELNTDGNLYYNLQEVITRDKLPASLPANGGNADTVGGKNADVLFVTGRGNINSADLDTVFVNRASGTYGVVNVGSIDLLISFRNPNDSSTSGLEFYTDYNNTTRILVRKILNRESYTEWKHLAYTTDIPTSLPANGGNANSVGGFSATNLMRRYTITVGGDTSHFYPCTWGDTNLSVYMSIHSPSLPGNANYNQNEITFLMSACGWSDMPRSFMCLEHGIYDWSEITIHSVYRGLENGLNCIYLRGGTVYTVFANVQLTPHDTEVKNGNEVYGIMSNDGAASTANVSKMWSYPDGISWVKKNGDQIINGNIELNTSNMSYLYFNRNGVRKGYVGLGTADNTNVQLVNSVSNAIFIAADDGKCYANGKEIATIDNMVTLSTSQTITGSKTFTQYCDFRGGAGNSGSDMRFKEEVRPVEEVLPDLLDLMVIRYVWNKEGEEKRDTFGISATELEEKGGVFEKIVHNRGDEQRTKWVEYDRVGVLALKGMQEMHHRWETEKRELNRELADLKQELAELRGMLLQAKNNQ